MRTCFVVLLSLLPVALQAQEDSVRTKEFNIGLGIGMDYGGFGVRGTFLPIEQLGLFASVGYNLNAAGFNAGAQWRFPKRRHAFFLTAMYGYNAVLIVAGDVQDKGTYYGVTAGGGYQLKVGRNGNFWNFELLVPFRNANFQDDFDALKAIGAITTPPLPVAFSVGFHFRARKRDS